MVKDYKEYPLSRHAQDVKTAGDRQSVDYISAAARHGDKSLGKAALPYARPLNFHDLGRDLRETDRLLFPEAFRHELEHGAQPFSVSPKTAGVQNDEARGSLDRSDQCLKTLDADKIVKGHLSVLGRHWTAKLPFIGSAINAGGRNIVVKSQATGKEVGVYETRNHYSADRAIGVAYVPEDEVYVAREYTDIAVKAGVMSEGKLEREHKFTSLRQISEFTEECANEVTRGKNFKAALTGLVLAGVFAASAVFAEDAPEGIYSAEAQDIPQYNLQID